MVAWAHGSINPARYTITAEFRGATISGRAAVNSYSASYRAGADRTFAVGQIQSTLMGGPADAMQAEAMYFELLRQARRHESSAGILRLRSAANQDLLVFHPAGQGVVEFTGTIRWVPLEGGFYAIEADDGRKFEPINLPRQYRKDGTRVRVKAKPRPDLASIRMYGALIEILEISPL